MRYARLDLEKMITFHECGTAQMKCPEFKCVGKVSMKRWRNIQEVEVGFAIDFNCSNGHHWQIRVSEQPGALDISCIRVHDVDGFTEVLYDCPDCGKKKNQFIISKRKHDESMDVYLKRLEPYIIEHHKFISKQCPCLEFKNVTMPDEGGLSFDVVKMNCE